MTKYAFSFLLLISILTCWACAREGSSATESSKELFGSSSEPFQPATPQIVDFEQLDARFNQENDTLYVYNFWATWCKPCVAELPYFEKINEKYASKKVKVVLVSLDFTDVLEKKVVPFLERKQIQSEVILLDAGNPNKWIDKINPNWSGAIPASLFIRSSQNKRAFYERDFNYEELEALVKEML